MKFDCVNCLKNFQYEPLIKQSSITSLLPLNETHLRGEGAYLLRSFTQVHQRGELN